MLKMAHGATGEVPGVSSLHSENNVPAGDSVIIMVLKVVAEFQRE